MIYLLLGESGFAKEKKISEIKSQTFGSSETVSFDYDLLYGSKLDPDDLKKSLIALPAVARQRLILLRSAEKLDAHNKNIILDFAQQGHKHVVLILDADEQASKSGYHRQLAERAKVLDFGGVAQRNIFDVTRAIDARDLPLALKILHELFRANNHPLQLMGGLVWFWGKTKNKMSADAFNKGLAALQQADLNIKRSRLVPEYAVEVAVTKLSLVIDG